MQAFGTDASGSLQAVLPDGSSEPEATTVAREIQHLVHSLPHATTDGSQRPQIKDSRLIALLSNVSFMNGSSLKRKPSVWAILENLHCTSPNPNPNPARSSTTSSPTYVGSETHLLKGDEPTTTSSSNPNQLSDDSLPSVAFSDTSSIMVYSPLIPTQSDLVELAELVPYDADSGEVEERDIAGNSGDDTVRKGSAQEVVVERSSWTLKWPFSMWYRQNQTQQGISQTLLPSPASGGPQQQSAELIASSQAGANNVDTNPQTTQRTRTVKPQRCARAWVPSPSKISVQAFWWGYRLYFPPPILEILSDQTLEAARRSELITTALTWFFNNLPVEVFPPPLRSVLVLLRTLIPFLGYIGTFIAWSWSSIRSYDVGYGVTLTATWILPVGLIPGTWYEMDFPKSPTPNSPIPLPRSRPFSMQSFEPPTPTVSSTTTTDDDDIPTSAYATPMSSVMLSSSLSPVPDALYENGLASSSTAWSASPPPQLPPPQLPISSPIRFPTTILSNSPNSLYFTPNSPTATAAATPVAYHFSQPLPSTSPVPLTLKTSTTLPSPRIRTPRFSTRMGSFSPSINGNNNSGVKANPPHLIIHNIIPPSSPLPLTPVSTSTSTPIPMPPMPIDLLPIPPELPLSPILVDQLLRGPVLQTVPLPDVDDGNINNGVGGDLDKSSEHSGVGRTSRGYSNFRKKGKKMETNNAV